MKQIVMAFRIAAILAFVAYLCMNAWDLSNSTVRVYLIATTLISIIIAILLQIGNNLYNVYKKDR